MHQVIKKSYLDWTREKDSRVQARGAIAVAMISQKNLMSKEAKAVSRCLWPMTAVKGDSLYMSRRVWIS